MWKDSGRGTVYRDYEWGYISFNPNAGFSIFDRLLEGLGQINGYGPETAICINDKDKTFGTRFLILRGDWREPFQLAAEKGLEPLVNVFLQNQDERHPSSDDYVIEGTEQ